MIEYPSDLELRKFEKDPITGKPLVRIDARRGLTILFAPIDVAGSGDNTLVSAVPGKRIKVLHYTLTTDAAVALRFKSGPNSNLSGAASLGLNGSISTGIGSPGSAWILETAAGEALVLNLGLAVGVRGHLTYFVE
jgi:hypothetical protein